MATGAGLLCAIARWGWSACAVGAVVVAVVVASIGASAWAGRGVPAVPRIAHLTLVASLALPAVAGLIAVLEGVGLLIVLALAGGSPLVTRRVVSRRRSARATATGRQPAQLPADDLEGLVPTRSTEPVGGLESLDDDALCLAWRRSFLVLQSARSDRDRLAVVAQRQRYLDELERRSPQALETWLASGARAAGNPLPFLRGHRPQGT